MAKIRITQPNIPAVVSNLGSIDKTMRDEVLSLFESETKSIQAEQVSITPVDTGLLQGSNERTVTSTPTGVEAVLYNDVEYAKFVEFGTGQSGSMSPPKYMPPGLEWAYGSVTGYRARPFFYPPILTGQVRMVAKMVKLNEEVAKRAIGQK